MLEGDFGPESQNRCISQIRVGTYADVVLKRGLQQEVRGDLQGIVHFKCFLGAQRRATKQFIELSERIANLAVHESASNAVFFPAPKRSVESRACRKLNVFSAHVTRTIVKAECRIEATIRSGIGPKKGLGDHPIDQIVPAAPMSRRVRKSASVIHAAEFVSAGIGLASSQGCRCLRAVCWMNQVTRFEEEIRSIANLEFVSSWVLLIGIPVPSHDRALNVKVPSGRKPDLGAGSTRRIERFKY